MKAASLAVALMSIVLAITVRAEAYAILGSGTMPCESWTTARRTPHGLDTAVNEQWVVGFLSGVGFMILGELDPLHGLTADAVYGWVDGYCGKHPQDTIEAAAQIFIQEHPR